LVCELEFTTESVLFGGFSYDVENVDEAQEAYNTGTSSRGRAGSGIWVWVCFGFGYLQYSAAFTAALFAGEALFFAVALPSA